MTHKERYKIPRIEVGQIIKTNYDTGPFKVESIVRGCICTHVLDKIENIENPLPPHLHLTVRDLKEGKMGYLNYYEEETLSYLRYKKDKIIICENTEPVQGSLLFAFLQE